MSVMDAPAVRNTLTYGCGCVEEWINYRVLEDGQDTTAPSLNCPAHKCTACSSGRACTTRVPELTIDDAAKSLEELNEGPAPKPRRRRLAAS